LTSIPIGAELNLTLQVVAFGLLLVGLRYAIQTHKAYAAGKEEGQKLETVHKNLMTAAVVLSGLGTVIWMVPSLFLGWYYKPSKGLGFGSGGYTSYFYQFGSTTAFLPQWYLIATMATLGTVVAVLGVYLVLRMRWSGFPQRLAVQNYRRLMTVTWSLWALNFLVGLAVFYFFALPGAAG
jgi:uncharacterized membrane protein YozB (DUF420 family)